MLKKKPMGAETPLHNGVWHPDIPPVERLVMQQLEESQPWEQKLYPNRLVPGNYRRVWQGLKAGEVFPVEMVDWTRGMIEDDDSAVDVKTIDLSTTYKTIYSRRTKSLSISQSRVFGQGWEPGDSQVIFCCKISNWGPLPRDEWGSLKRKWRWAFLDWAIFLCKPKQLIWKDFLEKFDSTYAGATLQSQLKYL
ncbi:hypothetical protein D5086_014877 [Populus alba]|uniref:Uncharacterized protein n=1 Tax=Populus alba TaxID=43335 RepID=A0ACC4C003_POPAL